MKSELQVSRFLALHVHVPRLDILENLCFFVDGSDVFAGHVSSWTLTNTCVFVYAFVSFSIVIESELACAACYITTQLCSVRVVEVPYRPSASVAVQWHQDVNIVL